jgi:hypothetical protein
MKTLPMGFCWSVWVAPSVTLRRAVKTSKWDNQIASPGGWPHGKLGTILEPGYMVANRFHGKVTGLGTDLCTNVCVAWGPAVASAVACTLATVSIFSLRS